jgi:flagellar hook protein FlgE
MLTSLYTGVSGMDANGTGLSVVGDNIANMNTTGFKSSRASFGDVLSQTLTGAGANQVGRGVQVNRVSAQQIQGSFESTGNNLDMAVDGDGFFVVKSGEIQYYTRDGQFSADKDGYIVNNDGYRVQGFQADSSGNITGTVGDLNINSQQSQASATTKASVSVNLNAQDTDFGGDTFTLGLNNDTPTNYSESTTTKIYDSLGAAHDVTMYFVKTGVGSWNVHYVHTDPTDATKLVDAGTQTLSFDTDGSLIDDGSATPIAFDFGAQAVTPQSVTFDYGTGTGETPAGTGFDGTTQFASSFSVTQLTQDGFGAGSVTSVNISEDGHITASFTNGQSRIIGQMALARFLAPDSLAKLGRNLYNETFDSGQPIIAKPETSGNGRVLSKSLELSNVDLAQEFVKLISYQRAFQANSRVITTTDTLMQDLISVVR